MEKLKNNKNKDHSQIRKYILGYLWFWAFETKYSWDTGCKFILQNN